MDYAEMSYAELKKEVERLTDLIEEKRETEVRDVALHIVELISEAVDLSNRYALKLIISNKSVDDYGRYNILSFLPHQEPFIRVLDEEFVIAKKE